MPAELDEKVKCASCGVKNPVMKRCTRCQAVFYCSRECQVKHWKAHKFWCGPNPQESIHDHEDTQRNDGAASPTLSGGACTPCGDVPFRTGCRIRPDGGYEAYAAGNLCDDRGFPVRKNEPESSEVYTHKQVRQCLSCGGQGKTSTTCEGILRTEYCKHCEGEGVLLA